jgi:hypothetical protein
MPFAIKNSAKQIKMPEPPSSPEVLTAQNFWELLKKYSLRQTTIIYIAASD